MAKKNLNDYIRKSHITALEKFKAELEQYKETCDPDGWLYEDANTSFTLDNIRLEDGYLKYDYDGKPEQDMIVCLDEETDQYFEESLDGIMDTVKFWRKCLNRAKKFWSMDPDHLDAIQNGEAEFNDDEEEDAA
jgi:hypothetical protein